VEQFGLPGEEVECRPTQARLVAVTQADLAGRALCAG